MDSGFELDIPSIDFGSDHLMKGFGDELNILQNAEVRMAELEFFRISEKQRHLLQQKYEAIRTQNCLLALAIGYFDIAKSCNLKVISQLRGIISHADMSWTLQVLQQRQSSISQVSSDVTIKSLFLQFLNSQIATVSIIERYECLQDIIQLGLHQIVKSINNFFDPHNDPMMTYQLLAPTLDFKAQNQQDCIQIIQSGQIFLIQPINEYFLTTTSSLPQFDKKHSSKIIIPESKPISVRVQDETERNVKSSIIPRPSSIHSSAEIQQSLSRIKKNFNIRNTIYDENFQNDLKIQIKIKELVYSVGQPDFMDSPNGVICTLTVRTRVLNNEKPYKVCILLQQTPRLLSVQPQFQAIQISQNHLQTFKRLSQQYRSDNKSYRLLQVYRVTGQKLLTYVSQGNIDKKIFKMKY